MSRKSTFVLAFVYLAVILIVGLIYFIKRDALFFVPVAFGPVPVGVPWFGALGAVLISLTGVFEHEHDWDSSYWPWHVSRPLIGMALGVVSVLIVQAGILAVGSTPLPTLQQRPTATPSPTPTATATATPTPAPSPASSSANQTGSAPATPGGATPSATASPSPSGNTPTPAVPPNLLYYLIAFLVGYREETFRELIKRLVDIVLSPGNGKPAAPSIQGVNPAHAPHTTPTAVVITGKGLSGTLSVKFGNTAAQIFNAETDGRLTVTTPIVQAGGAVPLIVTTPGGAATTQFTFD